ncbi:MAG TPA: tRNA (N(6)-L-threonylcarbamoyladenosine(37)-C(2))-methylthiotransferase MtaB [Actinomycetota bacterium]|nr:tRNA (N(6)-L-threonylcarbamoyladenosine(37)-C(2))-methylthiotransferase MtaB [Actinomycetota bacterium]
MGAPASFRFTTLGCRLNQAESDAMAEELASSGLVAAAEDEEPDVVVVNTCTVTREATKASRMALRRAIRSHPAAKVVAIGCYAESDPDELARIEGVDLVLGNAAKETFGEALGANQATGPLLRVGFRRDPARPEAAAPGAVLAAAAAATPAGPVAAPMKVRANLKAQTGCDEWCTFCIIPKTRGPLRSMDEDRLVDEAARRVRAGAKELVLTGVHLGKYRFDEGGDERDLIRLLQRLLEIDGVMRLRLSSILSAHLTDEVIAYLADEPRICRYLHVPLQAGHDEILAAMHRPYRIAEFLERVEAADTRLPALALATDIIVGFPGETEQHFQATLDVVRRVGFSKLHVFRYSARDDTPAAGMADAVAPEIKKDRSKRLIEVGNEIRARFLHAHLGRPLRVLVEDERVVDGVGICSGQTDDYVRVWFEGTGLLGRLVDVVGHEVRADGIRGGTVVGV